MVNGMEYVGDLPAIPDSMLASLLRNPTQARAVLTALFQSDVPAIVVEELGKAPTVVAAAAAQVAAQLAAADVVLGGDKRVIPSTAKVGWYLMPESSGYMITLQAITQRDAWILAGITLDGSWKFRGDADSGASGGAVLRAKVPDAIPEWWVGLPQWHLDTIYATALGRKGEVLAADFNARSGPVVAQVATAPVDDHNVPGRCTIPGRGTALFYTHHGLGGDSQLRAIAAGGTGRADTLTGKAVSSFNMGGAASYSQPWNLAHARTATTDTFWTFVRVALKWCIRETVADWQTSTMTATAGIKQLIEFPDQAYMHTSVAAVDELGNPTKVGIIAGFNPAVAKSAVYVLELDLKTGKMHDKMNVQVTQDINSGTPLQSTALTPVLPDKTTGTRRVLGLHCGGGGKLWKLLTVEYPGAVGPDGVITEWTLDVDLMQVVGNPRTFGATGRHFERYPGGAQFDRDGKVWHINESGNVYTLSLEGVSVRKSSRGMLRVLPVMPIVKQAAEPPIDVLTGDVGSYTDYTAWSDVNLLAIKKGS